jgi:hypothetical protein
MKQKQVIKMRDGETKSRTEMMKWPTSSRKARDNKKTDSMIQMLYDPSRDEWMLSFQVNDEGIGNILLPPDLSSLLQSETVTVSPLSGGIFIRSI